MIKILILGASSNQLPLILESKRQGYFVVDCDNTTTNPGLKYVDKHYQVNFMDKEKVLEIARNERINGVISNSEPAMPIVAFISQQLGLVGNTVESVSYFMQKGAFRNLQKKVNIYAPKHFTISSIEEFYEIANSLNYPIIIKPSQSSGSRGTTILEDISDKLFLRKTFEDCINYSRNNEVTVEEYVDMVNPEILEGEIFVHKGKIIWNCLFYNRRSKSRMLVPMTDCGPVKSNYNLERTKNAIESLIKESGFNYGQLNPEMYITKDNKIFIVEINPRQGMGCVNGFVEQFSGVNLNKLYVTTAVGDDNYFNELIKETPSNNLIVHHKVFSRKNGLYGGLFISEELSKYVVNYKDHIQKGFEVKACMDATDIVSEVFLKFEDVDLQYHYYNNLEKYIYPIID